MPGGDGVDRPFHVGDTGLIHLAEVNGDGEPLPLQAGSGNGLDGGPEVLTVDPRWPVRNVGGADRPLVLEL